MTVINSVTKDQLELQYLEMLADAYDQVDTLSSEISTLKSKLKSAVRSNAAFKASRTRRRLELATVEA